MISCEEKLVVSADSVETITYSYFDSSVPPEYHRSFVINLTPTMLDITVDSYGDILAQEEMEVSAEDFNKIIDVINEAHLVSSESKVDDCDGGTSESLRIIVDGKQVYLGNFDHCGGNEIPEKAGDVKKVVQTIKGLIPNFHDYLK